MHREEAEKYKTGGLCLYCQSEPPGDLAIPAWVNRILHWGVSSASRTKKTAAVADEADGCDVYEGGGSLGKEEEEADESDHEMDVGDEIMDADEKTTETKDDEEVFEMTS